MPRRTVNESRLKAGAGQSLSPFSLRKKVERGFKALPAVKMALAAAKMHGAAVKCFRDVLISSPSTTMVAGKRELG